MRIYHNLGWSAAFVSAVFFTDTFFASTMSMAAFGAADFGHWPVQQYRQSFCLGRPMAFTISSTV